MPHAAAALTNKSVFNCLLNWQRLSDDRSEAGSLFKSHGPATSNDLSPRRVRDHRMTHVTASDERRRRLASGADLHASERYDGAQPCSDLNISVASLKYTWRRTGSECNSCRTREMCSDVLWSVRNLLRRHDSAWCLTKQCGRWVRLTWYAPAHLVCESHLRWGTFSPNLGTLGLWVFELFAMSAMDGQIDG